MALGRRRTADNGLDPWPGYVDALSTLLMVIVFVLLVFVLSQAFLAATLSGRNQALDEMRRELADIRATLARERGRADQYEAMSGDLERRFGQVDTARRALSRQLDDTRLLVNQLTTDRDRLTLRASDAGLALEAATVAAERMRMALTQAQERAEQATRDKAAADGRTAEAARVAAAARIDATTAQSRANAADARRESAERDQQASAIAAAAALRERDQSRTAAEAARRERDAARDEAEARQRTLTDAERARDEALAELARAQARAVAALNAEAAARARLAEVERQIAELDRTVRADKATIEARLSELAELARQAQALRALRDQLQQQIRDTDARLAAEVGRREAAEADRKGQADAINLARAEVLALRRELEAQQAEMARIARVLELSQQDVTTKAARITDLDRRLNAALAARIEHLQQYRSEFFGRLRTLLESRTGIQVVGDRFVFQSEVLFPVGSAEMTPAGVGQMTTLAISIKQIAQEIPPDVPWVLRVDGHTDRTPVRGGLFASNWELSAARAINVVKFLIAAGVAPERLAATAFGEYQPIASGDTPDALARDRRIELRLTDR